MNNERYENMELTDEQMESISGGIKFQNQFEPICGSFDEYKNFINGRLA